MKPRDPRDEAAATLGCALIAYSLDPGERQERAVWDAVSELETLAFERGRAAAASTGSAS